MGSESYSSLQYSYFALNKDSGNITLGQALQQYMASPEGQQNYVTQFPYYLSAETTVIADMMEKKINPNYNIVYKNFLPDESEKRVFGVCDRAQFYSEVPHILDQESDYVESFSSLASRIICSATKSREFQNLSSPCK